MSPTPQPVETLPAVEALQSAVKLFASFSTSDSFKYLQDILKKNSSSKAKIKELEIAKKVNLETLVDLKSELRDASDRASKSQAAHEKAEEETKLLEATIEDLKKKVSDQEKELRSTSDEMTHLQMVLKRREVEVRESKDGAKEADEQVKSALKRETDANTALAKMREEFNEESDELRQFESFKLQLPDASLQAVSKQMGTIWGTVYKLVSTYYGQDLHEDILSSPDPWEKLHSHRSVTRLPLSVSNSPLAKHMRVAAVLRIISSILCEQIFRPNYILEDSNELSNLLDDLLLQDRTKERHLRAELLALFPATQGQNGAARTDSAVVDIFAYCSGLIPKDKQPGFRTALETVCNFVLIEWTQSQRLRQRIEPILDPQIEGQWKLLPWLNTVDRSQKGHTAIKQGSASQNTAHASSNTAKAKREGSAVIERNAIVWPGFKSVDLHTDDVVSEGLGLSDAQMQAAIKEEHENPSPGPRRLLRANFRKSRSNSLAINEDDNPVKLGKSFLSRKLGDSNGG